MAPDKLPLLVVTDGAATGIFAASGYSVGISVSLGPQQRIIRNAGVQ